MAATDPPLPRRRAARPCGAGTLEIILDLEGGRLRPTWRLDVHSRVDGQVSGVNEHGNTITTSLVDGTTIVWILGGCLRGHLEGWRPCRPEERSAGTIQAEKAESDYWRAQPPTLAHLHPGRTPRPWRPAPALAPPPHPSANLRRKQPTPPVSPWPGSLG